jgi:hypothetical protein
MPNLTARQMLSQIPVRMAAGGEARAFSDDEVKQFIQSTYAQFGGPGVEAHKAIADAMAQYGVGVNQVARATGYTPREVEAEFMGQRAGARPVLDDPTGSAAGMSAAYRAAATAGGQQTVDDYYANLRKDAEAYLANANAPTGVDAYNTLIQSGISTSDLRAAGVADAVLDKIFTVQAPIAQEQFVTPAGMTSAYERSPDLAFESQRLTAQGQDGRAILDKQGRDYIANLQQDGIDAAERAQMLEYATERGYSFQDLIGAGVDPNVLFVDDGSAAAKAAADKAAADAAAAAAEQKRLMDIKIAEEAERVRQAAAKAAADRAAADAAAKTAADRAAADRAAADRAAADRAAADKAAADRAAAAKAAADKAAADKATADAAAEEGEERRRREETIRPCPSPEMQISLADGTLKKAGDLQLGDKVKTQHETTLEWGDYEVTHVSVIPNTPRLMFKFDGLDFVCSHSHKFFTEDGKWVDADAVAVGDRLSGKTVLAVVEHSDGPVVRITVADAHTYICEGLFSHNKSLPPPVVPTPPVVTPLPVVTPPPPPPVTPDELVKAVTPTGPTAAELQAAIDAANAKAAKDAADAKAAREAAEAAERARIAALTGAAVTAVTPSYNAKQLQDIIKAAEGVKAAEGTVTNPLDTRGSAATGSQSGVTTFLDTYEAPKPFVAPAYTAPTVYQPIAPQPDMFAAGQPALDTAFRESSPRTAIPGQPGQFDYSPAAKLRPATGSGFTFTPPSITTRPRSLLSPREIQGYGGTMSASQRFAQNRSLIDRNLRDMLGATPALRNASTYNLLRNRVMAGEFGADPARVFDPTTTEGQKFQAFLASLAGTAPAQAAATGAATGTVADFVSEGDPTDRQIAAGGGTTSGTTVAGGYAAPIDASPLAYGGYRLEPFSKGGAVNKNNGVARYAEGGEASAAELLRQLEGIDNTPTARTPEPEPEIEQTESRSMLQNIVAGAKQIPGTVFDYGRGIAQSENPLAQIRSDVGAMGGAMVEGAKQDPLGFALDMTPIIGEIRSGIDAKKYSDMANEAEAAGNTALADSYRQVSTMAAAGAVPFGGIGARGAKRTAISNITDVPPDSARGMLDALTPEADIDVPRTPGEDVDALTALDQPPAGSAAAMLDEVENAADASPIRLAREETQAIDKAVKNRNTRRKLKTEARRIKGNYLAEDGWTPIQAVGMKKGKPDFKGIAYGFEKPPAGMEKAAWSNTLSNNLVTEVDSVVERARSGDQAAIDILRQANWYRTMRDQLRSEFGGVGDVFADVLGTTSAQTNVEQNFRNATEILRRYSRGEFDTELQAYENRIKQGLPVDGKALTALHNAGEFPLITSSSGKLFNTNSPSSMGALLDMFRSVKTGSAPKTPNFTGNLIGLTNEATIDVWAARMLRRLSGQSRIPPVAENTVTGKHLVGSSLGNPKVGGEFGFGQDVFKSAADRINASGGVKSVIPEMGDLGPDDLQAVAWFMEKELWTKNGWTTKAGEGGSLEYEMSLAGGADQVRIDDLRREINAGFKAPNKRKKETDAEYAERVAQARRTYDNRQELAEIELRGLESPLQRYTLGVSGEIRGRKGVPNKLMSNYEQAELAAEFDDVLRNDQSVRGYNLANAYGLFAGEKERSLNAEIIVGEDFIPDALTRRLVEQGKFYDQDAVFISKSVKADAPNARPGVEIYFRKAVPLKTLEDLTQRLRDKGIDGFTSITDMRFGDKVNRQSRSGDPETASLTGLRFQYVPEFDDSFDPSKANEIYARQQDLYSQVVEEMLSEGNVSDARLTHYDTKIFFRDDYDDYLRGTAPENNPEIRRELTYGANDPQPNNGGSAREELSKLVSDGVGQAARASPQEGIDNFAKGGAVTSSRRMLENLIGKKPEGQRVDATGLLGFANGGEARVGGSAPAVAGRTGRAAQLAAQRVQDPQTESRAMLERLNAATPVERAVFESTGMEPGLDRAMMLPFAGSREEGNLQLAAPGFVYDAARAFVTPGMAARGQQVSDEDILNTAMNVMGGGAGASRVAGPRTAPDEMLLGMGVGSRGAPTAADDLAELTPANPDDYEITFHRSNEPSAFTVLPRYRQGGAEFDGVFAGPRAGMSGDYLHAFVVPKAKILRHYDLKYDVPYEDYQKAVRAVHPEWDDEQIERAFDYVTEDKNIIDQDPEDYADLFKGDSATASNLAQGLRGAVARNLGYDAVEMLDETGTSLQILSGARSMPLPKDMTFDDATREIYKSLKNPKKLSTLSPSSPEGTLGKAPTAADDLAALTDRAPKLIDSLPGRNELNYWIDGGQDAVERGFPEEPFILLDKLYIDPQNRGQGAARQVLVEGLQEMAEQYPGMDVRLLAEPLDRSTNQSDLVRLYESVGFEVDNYQDGMSSIPMSLRLPKKVARTGGNTPTAALGYVKGGAVTKNNVERMRNDNRRYL